MKIRLTEDQKMTRLLMSNELSELDAWAEEQFPELTCECWWWESFDTISILDEETRPEVLRSWIETTAQAINGLQEWLYLLKWLQEHDFGYSFPLDKEEFMAAFRELVQAGLESWVDECTAGGGIDVLAEAVTGEEV